MKLIKNKRVGVTSHTAPKKTDVDIRVIERFYYCAVIALLLRIKNAPDSHINNPIDINIYLLKWVDRALTEKLWGDSINNEAAWIRRSILNNPFSKNTLEVLINIQENLHIAISRKK